MGYMYVKRLAYDRFSNKTHVQLDTGYFTEWYWVSGECDRALALDCLEPLIVARLTEFGAGLVDTPHEIESQKAGLL